MRRHLSSGSLSSVPGSGALDQSRGGQPLTQTGVTFGTSEFFVMCQNTVHSALNLLVNSVLPLVGVFTAFDRKVSLRDLQNFLPARFQGHSKYRERKRLYGS